MPNVGDATSSTQGLTRLPGAQPQSQGMTVTPAAPMDPAASTDPSHQGAALNAVGATASNRPSGSAPSAQVLRTYFAPYDEPIRQDLELIRTVTEARRHDPTVYPPEDCPYTLQYFVYNLRHDDVIAALIEAAHAGVKVRVVTEADQLLAERDWNTADERFEAAGLTVVRSVDPTREPFPEQAHMVGVRSPRRYHGDRDGLMHHKIRLGTWLDAQGMPQQRALSGSFNPGDAAPFNDETLQRIEDPWLIGRLLAKTRAVMEGRLIENSWDEARPINVLFTPAKGELRAIDKLFEWIEAVRAAIFISVFSLRNVTNKKRRQQLLQLLDQKVAEGVPLVVLTDRKQSDGVDAAGNRTGWDDDFEDKIRALRDKHAIAGRAPLVSVYECINQAGPFNAMHNKYALLGLTQMRVISDCTNWTTAALGDGVRSADNDETMQFIDSARLDHNRTGRRYLSNVLQLLRKYSDQQTEAPPAEALIAQLQQRPGWPSVEVDLRAEARTAWGQQIALTGDHALLGDWNRNGVEAVPLQTDAASYPSWHLSQPVTLPFGARVEFKLIKRDQATGEVIAWEDGRNRSLVVDAGDLRAPGVDLDQGSLSLSLRYR